MSEIGAEEIDFEIDVEDLPAPPAPRELGAPSVLVDDLHVHYRVFGASKGIASGASADASVVRRLLGKGRRAPSGVREVKAVRGVSFVARHGESIGIVGTNGSGKSTLLRALAGLIPPAAGSVFVSGTPSLLGVNAVLMKQLTGERNIMIGGLALGLTSKEVHEKFDEIVEFSGLGDFIYLPMKAYSAGMSARLRFAISTAATPDILMIDEALATGDASFRQKSSERIDEIRSQAGTIFLVSHSLASVRAMCNRVIWIDKGIIRMDGDVDTVTEEYRKFTKRRPKD